MLAFFIRNPLLTLAAALAAAVAGLWAWRGTRLRKVIRAT